MPLQNAQINNSITWTRRDSIGETLVIENGQNSYSVLFASGTGTGKVTNVWYATGGLPPGGSVTYNLFSLSGSIFGNATTLNLSGNRIKSLFIENSSTGDQSFDLLEIQMKAPSGLRTPFGGYDTYFRLNTGGNLMLSDRIGYLIDTGNRYVTILNSGTLANYSIGILV